jgi:hypothetical protein
MGFFFLLALLLAVSSTAVFSGFAVFELHTTRRDVQAVRLLAEDRVNMLTRATLTAMRRTATDPSSPYDSQSRY